MWLKNANLAEVTFGFSIHLHIVARGSMRPYKVPAGRERTTNLKKLHHQPGGGGGFKGDKVFKIFCRKI
jgi:hypothetical protein